MILDISSIIKEKRKWLSQEEIKSRILSAFFDDMDSILHAGGLDPNYDPYRGPMAQSS